MPRSLMPARHLTESALDEQAKFAQTNRARVLFVNRSYWPDVEATGQLLTELCEDLAPSFDVSVLAGQPNHNPSAEQFLPCGRQRRRGVTIHRVRHTRFGKARLAGRVVNLLTFLAGAAWRAVRLERPDVVVVETDPPLLCLLGGMLQRRRGAKLVVYLQDIYPDLAIALGKLRDGAIARRLARAMHGVYRRADRVVVLSRDMQAKVVALGVDPRRVVCVPNWIDTTVVVPRREENAFRSRHGLTDRFVVMYSGNLGLTQPLDDVLAAARLLRDRREIVFLLVGEGAAKTRLQAAAREMGLSNLRFLSYQPKSELADSLSAADLHLAPLDPRLVGCLMPSKLYGILAAGVPVAAIAPDACELAEIVLEERVGVVVPPHDPSALAERIAAAAADPAELKAMGSRARRLAERQYDRPVATARFAAVLAEVVREAEAVERIDGNCPGTPVVVESCSGSSSFTEEIW